MGDAPKPSARRARLGKAERAQAQQRRSPEQRPLPDQAVDVRHVSHETPEARLAQAAIAGRHLTTLLTEHVEGVVKICPTEDPMVCYSYFRWSRGRWAGHYVCSLSSISELGKSFGVLLRRVEDVELGTRKPTRDRYQ